VPSSAAVDLRAEEKSSGRPRRAAVVINGVAAQHVGANRVKRLLDDEPHADRRRKVETRVDRCHRVVDQVGVQDGADD